MYTRLLTLVLVLTFSIKTAYGYIDPGTGSYIIQLLIAALATSLYAIKYFWSSIRGLFSSLGKKKDKKVSDAKGTKTGSPMHAKKK